jgi:hypothetical protein
VIKRPILQIFITYLAGLTYNQSTCIRSYLFYCSLFSISASAQLKKNNISRILGTLAADSMAGRKAGSEQSDKAAALYCFRVLKKARLDTYLEQRVILQSFGNDEI